MYERRFVDDNIVSENQDWGRVWHAEFDIDSEPEVYNELSSLLKKNPHSLQICTASYWHFWRFFDKKKKLVFANREVPTINEIA